MWGFFRWERGIKDNSFFFSDKSPNMITISRSINEVSMGIYLSSISLLLHVSSTLINQHKGAKNQTGQDKFILKEWN